MFARILIPLDGSPLAERAIPHAERFARIFGARIVLLQVLDTTSNYENSAPLDPLSWQIHKAEADLYLNGLAAQIRARFDVPEGKPEDPIPPDDRVEYAIREGKTAENIIDFAHQENIDLLVISSHGSSGLSRWSMSNVIQKVIDLIYLPLLIVRSNDLPEETSGNISYRRILVPMDSSLRAECVLPAGIVLTQGEALLESTSAGKLPETERSLPEPPEQNGVLLKPSLFLATVITPPEIPIPKPYPVEIQELSNQLLQVSRKAVLAYLIEIKRRLPVESETLVVESNHVTSAIQELANQENIDLILMSAHGYSGQFTHPYGSVTRNYIERGTKSILIIQDVPRSMIQHNVSAAVSHFDWQIERNIESPLVTQIIKD